MPSSPARPPGGQPHVTDPPRRSALHNLWRIRHYVRPYLGQMIFMTAAAGLAVGASIVVPLVMQLVIDGPIRHGNAAALPLLGTAVLVLGLTEAALIFTRRWIQSEITLRMEAKMRDDLYAHLQRLPVAFHDRWQSGQLLSRVTTDLGVIRRFLAFGLVFLLINGATYITVVALLIHLYWPLGLTAAVGAVPLALISRSFARRYISISRRVQDEQGDLATNIEEAAYGIRVVKAFGRRRHLFDGFDARARRLHDSAVDKTTMSARFWALFDVVPSAMLAVVVVAGAVAVTRGELTLGALVAFVTLQLMLVWPIESMGWILANGQEAMTAADRVYEVFDTEPTIVDRPDAVDVRPADVRGHLRFDGVGFTYPSADEPILRGIDLDVRPGETIAIVGVTGSGKTTLVSLVPRLHDVTRGAITIDGRDVRDHTLSSLRHVVGTAFEDPTLFSMSVRENLSLGRPEATDDDLAEALRVAQAEFVYDLPWGLDTRVGEQGLSLSGGQRQRLALARAVIVKPKVLVLDDPLSALDVHTEELVERALARVLKGTTALLVVHRPSTVALADRVALLDDGRIAAVGTHSELLATDPRYRAVLSQSADAESPAAQPERRQPAGRGVAAR